MKTRLCCTLLAAATLAIGCKKELNEYEKNQQLRLSRVDLTGAQYLVQSSDPASKSTENNKDLFKIDKEGKMTAVVFSFTYSRDENGNQISQEVRTDIKVVPHSVANLDNGQYLLLRGCDFFDAQGNWFYIEDYINNSSFLVRAKDGAVFLWPNDVSIWDEGLKRARVDAQGDLFFSHEKSQSKRNIAKVALQGDKTVLKTLTPPEFNLPHFALTDHTDTFIAGNSWGSYSESCKWYSPYIFYPNGGFETIKETGGVRNDEEYIINIGTKIKRVKLWSKAVKQSDDPSDRKYDYYDTLLISNINTTNAPPYTESAPVRFTRSTAERSDLSLHSVIECKNHYVLAGSSSWNSAPSMLIVCQKSDNNLLQWEQSSEHSFHGQLVGTTKIALGAQPIKKYDFETFTYTEVPYSIDQFGAFVSVTLPELSADAKVYTVYGVRNSDGRSIIIEIDTQTGAATMTEAPENRTITELIRLN